MFFKAPGVPYGIMYFLLAGCDRSHRLETALHTRPTRCAGHVASSRKRVGSHRPLCTRTAVAPSRRRTAVPLFTRFPPPYCCGTGPATRWAQLSAWQTSRQSESHPRASSTRSKTYPHAHDAAQHTTHTFPGHAAQTYSQSSSRCAPLLPPSAIRTRVPEWSGSTTSFPQPFCPPCVARSHSLGFQFVQPQGNPL